ncbi:MAG: ABC transporter permease [Gracilibacteraceae bacterium]|jgi:peptide/nickel transport system permease protein|nr:ABC transporter permease [Gracilibacteraceae bacterium]
MAGYAAGRLLQAVALFFCITCLAYVLLTLAPGGPLSTLRANADISEEQIAKMTAQLGLDKPVLAQYGAWIGKALTGDLGTSFRTSQPVAATLSQRIGPSLLLTLSALLAAVLIGIPLGIASALRPGAAVDKLATALSFLTSSIPSFLLSLGLIFIFAVKLKLLPAQGMFYAGSPPTPGALLIHLFLPSLIIAGNIVGGIIKQTKGSVLEVLGEDFVRAAVAKGIGRRRVVLEHVFRNALIPVVTQIGLLTPFLVGGAVVVEQIFSWPGLGSLLVQSIINRDYPTVMGAVTLITAAVLTCNILLDFIYMRLDPRITLRIQ